MYIYNKILEKEENIFILNHNPMVNTLYGKTSEAFSLKYKQDNDAYTIYNRQDLAAS